MLYKKTYFQSEPRKNNRPFFTSNPIIQSKCATCKEENILQTKPLMMKSESGGGVATSALTSQLNSSKSGGSSLPVSTNQFMSNAFGFDFSGVRVHTGSNAIQMNQGLNARAFTHGPDLYFNKGEYSPESSEGKRLLGHELTHVVQQGRGRPSDLKIQKQAGVGSLGKVVVKKTLQWLAKRGKTVSKHVGRHTRAITGRAVHSVFKSPNQVKKLVERTLKSADNVVVQQGRHRTRYVIEKQFNREIGKNGETILKVVVEESGRIVTAYPVQQFTRAGVVAGIMFLSIDDASAQAREKLDRIEKNVERMIEAEKPSFWEDIFLDIVTFGLYGGQLNAGEDAALYGERKTQKVIEEAVSYVINEVETEEKRSLDETEREEIRNIVLSGLQTGFEL